MDLRCKNLTFFLIIILSVSIKTLAAFYFEDEPSLISENLRLAGLGGINIVLEEYDNEINLYDFGELPAGVIDDDNGESSIYVRGKYGVDGVKEISSETEWSGSNFTVGGIYKYMNRWAVGNSFARLKRDLRFYSPTEMTDVRYDIRNFSNTSILALHIADMLNLGIRSAYHRDMIKTTEYINFWQFEGVIWCVEPSISIDLFNSKLCLGLGYEFREDDWNAVSTRNLKFPVVYQNQHLGLGIKLNYKRKYTPGGFMRDKEIHVGMRSKYKIPVFDKTINIGFLIDRDIVYEYSQSHETMYNWLMNYGGGIAIVDEDFGLVGIQLQQMNYHRYAPAYPKQTILNFGIEYNLFESIPVRLGYLFHSWNPEYPYCDQTIVTMGFGVYLMDRRMKFDFAYNLRKGSLKWYHTFVPDIYYDTQNIWGLVARFIF